MSNLIFKLQRSINKEDETVLIYDKNREYMGELPMNLALSLIMGIDQKCYVSGTIDENGYLEIYKRVKDRKW